MSPSSFPSAIWLLRTYMMRIPRELEEAAYVDGAGYFYTFRRVVLPLATPGIAVVAITTFIGAYAQQFIFALTFNSKTEYMPLPIGSLPISAARRSSGTS